MSRRRVRRCSKRKGTSRLFLRCARATNRLQRLPLAPRSSRQPETVGILMGPHSTPRRSMPRSVHGSQGANVNLQILAVIALACAAARHMWKQAMMVCVVNGRPMHLYVNDRTYHTYRHSEAKQQPIPQVILRLADRGCSKLRVELAQLPQSSHLSWVAWWGGVG